MDTRQGKRGGADGDRYARMRTATDTHAHFWQAVTEPAVRTRPSADNTMPAFKACANRRHAAAVSGL